MPGSGSGLVQVHPRDSVGTECPLTLSQVLSCPLCLRKLITHRELPAARLQVVGSENQAPQRSGSPGQHPLATPSHSQGGAQLAPGLPASLQAHKCPFPQLRESAEKAKSRNLAWFLPSPGRLVLAGKVGPGHGGPGPHAVLRAAGHGRSPLDVFDFLT